MSLIMGKGNGPKRGVVMPVGDGGAHHSDSYFKKLQAAYLDQRGQAGDARMIKHRGLVMEIRDS